MNKAAYGLSRARKRSPEFLGKAVSDSGVVVLLIRARSTTHNWYKIFKLSLYCIECKARELEYLTTKLKANVDLFVRFFCFRGALKIAVVSSWRR